MKRTTIFIDESTERELELLARRRGESKAALVREALSEYLSRKAQEAPRDLGFVGVGRSGRGDVAERHEELLWQEPPEEAGEEAEAGEEEGPGAAGPPGGEPPGGESPGGEPPGGEPPGEGSGEGAER